MSEKNGKRIVLGITGGIAAYKSAELTRLLTTSGIDVQVIMTEAGCRFIGPVTLQALSGNLVFVDAWDNRVANNMAHIELSRKADAIVVAPASADFLAKLASGLANDLLSTLCIARPPTCPLLLAPAMNREMWENPATRRNVAQLKADGIVILGPDAGDQACGETGIGRMREPGLLHEELLALFRPKLLSGRRALVTAGPTFEAIDPVRGITNRSSGKMGYAIASALVAAGAEVILISGPTGLTAPYGATLVEVESASQMFNAVQANLRGVELFFSVAAVADYTPADPKLQKMKKSETNQVIEVVPTTDILGWVAQQPSPPFCVGFAAESENVVEYARIKRQKKRIPVIIANQAMSAIGSDMNSVTIIDAEGGHEIKMATKTTIAHIIVAHIARLFLQFSNPANKPALESAKNA